MISDPEMLMVLSDIIRREGGFVDDPVDEGGATNWGVTKNTLEVYLGRPVTIEEVRNLPIELASQIYLNDYIKKVNLDSIPDISVFHFCADAAVNHGTKRAIRWLQMALGVEVDGVIGKDTKAKMESLREEEWRRVFKVLCAKRIKFYVEIVLSNPPQIKFLRGWIARATSFLEA